MTSLSLWILKMVDIIYTIGIAGSVFAIVAGPIVGILFILLTTAFERTVESLDRRLSRLISKSVSNED